MTDPATATEPTEPARPAPSGGRRRAKQAGILMYGRVLATLSEALVPLVMVRLVGKAEVGVLGGLIVLYNTAALLLASGLPAAVMYFVPTREAAARAEAARKIAGLMAGLGVVLSLVMVSVALAMRSGSLPLAGAGDNLEAGGSAFDPEALGLLVFLALYPLGDIPGRMLPNLLVAEGRAGAAAAFGIFKSVGTAAAILVPLAVGGGIKGSMLALSVFGLIQAAVLGHDLRQLYRDSPGPGPTLTRLHLVRFAIPLGMTDIVSMLNGRIDGFLIMGAFTAAGFAEYHAAAWQIPLITSIAYIVGSVSARDLAQHFQRGQAEHAVQLWRTSIEKVSLVVTPLALVFIVAAEEVMELLFTADYLRGAQVFRIYSLSHRTTHRRLWLGHRRRWPPTPRALGRGRGSGLQCHAQRTRVVALWLRRPSHRHRTGLHPHGGRLLLVHRSSDWPAREPDLPRDRPRPGAAARCRRLPAGVGLQDHGRLVGGSIVAGPGLADSQRLRSARHAHWSNRRSGMALHAALAHRPNRLQPLNRNPDA